MRLALAVVVMAFLGLSAPLFADTINFDSLAANQNINGLNLGGVTLTAAGGVVNVFNNNAGGAGFRSAPNSVSTPDGTGTMTGVFTSPVSFVQLFAGDSGGDTDSWRLDVFDAVSGGNLLGSALSGNFSGNPYLGLSLSAAGIRRFEATFTGLGGGIAYDDLTFTPTTPSNIPEPATWVLLSTGLLAVVSRRRSLASLRTRAAKTYSSN